MEEKERIMPSLVATTSALACTKCMRLHSVCTNLRPIMLQAGLNRVSDIIENCDFEYHKVSEEDMWRIDFVRELVELRHEDLDVSGIETEDLQHILEYLCTT